MFGKRIKIYKAMKSTLVKLTIIVTFWCVLLLVYYSYSFSKWRYRYRYNIDRNIGIDRYRCTRVFTHISRGSGFPWVMYLFQGFRAS